MFCGEGRRRRRAGHPSSSLREAKPGNDETKPDDDGGGQRFANKECGHGGGDGRHEVDVGGGDDGAKMANRQAPGDEARCRGSEPQEEQVATFSGDSAADEVGRFPPKSAVAGTMNTSP